MRTLTIVIAVIVVTLGSGFSAGWVEPTPAPARVSPAPGPHQEPPTETRPDEPAVQRAILVTGASSGIGRKTTELLASKGFFVYAGARKEKDLKELEAIENVQSIRLDVTIPAEIEANRLAWLLPTRRTVDVEQFCSWSAWRIKSTSSARATAGGTL